ncbi:unnamed protein product [Arabis nemorensis]|uniref:Uncharacterized protein n=1 Tax=Arabis nemorensis TaxID=586526 RepID=A0A565B0Z0_9BRAS|nr:unnamed protein product [Arabis nemorensis]
MVCFLSRQGRVALLVNVTRLTPFRNAGAELLTVKFLKGKMTPKEFANELEMDKNLSFGLTFNLVVADIHSKSMFYISKKTQNKEVDEIKEVGPGQYVITSAGIYDLTCPEGNNGTALLDVERTGKAIFFEIYPEKGGPIYRQFNFDME